MRIFKVDDEMSEQAELRTLAYTMESMSHKERMQAIKAHTNKHLLDLIGPNEPVDGFSKDPNRSIRPAARNELRDELRAKIEAWAGVEA
ncbi:hypothetical protein [Rhodococcus ruber]|uniref:hypothetical protein n=1 Tax=Rhodococcus ruber TaxID=1830 RepID=UPI001F252E7D|nr:hypothetical protein [Rhodococcus ruber]MCF8783213.1 hypothetical protein [Rhodococcus ruber]